MATIQIAIDTFAEDSDEIVHYEFTWTGNEKEARAVINHVEATTAGHGLKLGNLAHGSLHRLNEILANIGDPSEDDKAALLSYAFRSAVIENPSRGDQGRTVLERLAPAMVPSFSYVMDPSIARFAAPSATGPTLKYLFVSARERLDGLQPRNLH